MIRRDEEDTLCTTETDPVTGLEFLARPSPGWPFVKLDERASRRLGRPKNFL